MHNETLMAIWGVVAGFTSLLWLRAEWQRRKAEARLWTYLADQGIVAAAGPSHLPAVAGTQRVDQLERQLDQMAQQIDRLAESQEFLSRVLTDRIDQIPDPRLRTPH